MKKTILILFLANVIASMNAQTIVSTVQSNRNVIIENFTGEYCQYCPDAHRICDTISAHHPDSVFVIRIHQGQYATRYSTIWADPIAGQTGLSGYPSGTINRHVFSGNKTAVSRDKFSTYSTRIMNMVSPVNIAATATIDGTRQMSIRIEAYYTSNSTQPTNRLNVALLQNNVLGPQSGAQQWYPEMMVGSQYRHNHMLRDLLTGQWGIEIPATQGTFIDTTIIYTIPDSIGEVAIENLADLEVIAFIAEGHQEILTGCRATMTATHPIMTLAVDQIDCSLSFQPWATINNLTYDTVNNFVINYDGIAYTFTKTIPPMQADTIHLPLYTINMTGDDVQNCTTTKSASLVSYNGNNISGDTHTVTFADFNIYTVAGPFNARVGIDRYGQEASVQLIDMSTCSSLWSEEGWTNDLSASSTRYFNIAFSPADSGLYILRILDSYGDGWVTTNGTGIWLSDSNGIVFSESWGQSNAIAFSQLNYYLYITNTGTGRHGNSYTINVSCSPSNWGNAYGGGTYINGDTAILIATADTNYEFYRWICDNDSYYYSNPLSVVVNSNKTYTAIFRPIQYNVAVSVSPDNAGTVSGGGEHDINSLCTITATANYGYHFIHWSDGVTDNPRTFTIVRDTSFTAVFDPNIYSVTTLSNNTSIGTVSGGGEYYYLDTATLSAIGINHNHFVRWSDGNRDNPRRYVITGDTVLTAYFAIDTHTVSVATNDIARGMVEASGTEFIYGTPCTVTATAYTGYTFAGWSNGVNATPYTFAVLSDVELTALFVAEGEQTYTVTVVSDDPTMGTVSGGGQALDGGTVTIRAVGNPGYHFLRWNDNNTDSVRTVEVHGNVTYTAYFAANVGIDDVVAKGIRVYSCDGEIVLEGSEGMTVSVYDMMGRKVFSVTAAPEPCKVAVLQRGVYLVKVGNFPARKIVVVR